MARYWPTSYYNKSGKLEIPYHHKYGKPVVPHYNKYGKLEIPYRGESLGAKLHEYTRFPYTYAFDVPGILPYHRSFYGRAFSDYGYRAPYTHRSEWYARRHPEYFTDLELDYYKDFIHHPRYSRYHDYCKYMYNVPNCSCFFVH